MNLRSVATALIGVCLALVLASSNAEAAPNVVDAVAVAVGSDCDTCGDGIGGLAAAACLEICTGNACAVTGTEMLRDEFIAAHAPCLEYETVYSWTSAPEPHPPRSNVPS